MNILALARETIGVDVQFYDVDVQRKLLRYPTAAIMHSELRNQLPVPDHETSLEVKRGWNLRIKKTGLPPTLFFYPSHKKGIASKSQLSDSH